MFLKSPPIYNFPLLFPPPPTHSYPYTVSIERPRHLTSTVSNRLDLADCIFMVNVIYVPLSFVNW